MQILTAARAFLSSITGLIILALAALLAVQTVRIEGFKLWPLSIAGLKAERDAARDELKAITAKRDEQKPITTRKVEQAEQGRKQAERIKDRIIAAPPTVNCETPPIIMGLDI
jgi:hypothetical protein